MAKLNLRKGKTKTILKAALDAALLAVEIYNKPRTTFRSEAYIALMIIAWTRLFHAYFNATIGDKYYYRRNGSSHYKIIEGERKAWELTTCINKYGELIEPVQRNLEFFIKLRNKIEHRHIDKKEVDVLIFGECQALLFNFENTVITFFGEDYALHESLVYSLQFSHLRKQEQRSASKTALSKDIKDITNYVEKYRSLLSDEVYSSQEYRIQLIQIPKIANTNRSDLAIEFVGWNELGEEDLEAYKQIVTLIKDRKIMVEAINVGRLKATMVRDQVRTTLANVGFSMHTHTCLCKLFRIRPFGNPDDPSVTNRNFCLFDEPHGDYLYTESWPEFIITLLQSGRVTVQEIHRACRQNEIWDINDFTVEVT